MAKTAADHIATAQAAFEAGFASKAAQKRALDDMNRAYDKIRSEVQDFILACRTPENEEANRELYRSVPMELHQVRDRFFVAFEAFCPAECATLRDLIALRTAIKGAEITPTPAKPEIEIKAEKVRRAIAEEMERRKALYIEALNIARHFGGLPVSVNAHWVHGHKGAVFIRHFFYLRGKLTPLNTILAAAEAYAAEKKAAAH